MRTRSNRVTVIPDPSIAKAEDPLPTSYYESAGFLAPKDATPEIGENGKLTIFGLPSEIRNRIYELYAKDTRVNIGYCNQKRFVPPSISAVIDKELLKTEFATRHENSVSLPEAVARNQAEGEQAYKDFQQAEQAIAQAVPRVDSASEALAEARKARGHWVGKKETASERQNLHKAKQAEASARATRANALRRLDAYDARRKRLQSTSYNYWGGLHLANKQIYTETLSLRYCATILNASGHCGSHSSAVAEVRPHSLYSSLTRLTPNLTPCIRVLRLSARVDAMAEGIATFEDTAWGRLCTTAARSLPSLETLHVALHISGSGLAFTFNEHWVQSLLTFRQCRNLKWAWVVLRTAVLDKHYARDKKTREPLQLDQLALMINGRLLGQGPPASAAITTTQFTAAEAGELLRQGQRILRIRRKFAACQSLHKEFGHALSAKLLGVEDDEALAAYIPVADDHRARYSFDFCPQQIIGEANSMV